MFKVVIWNTYLQITLHKGLYSQICVIYKKTEFEVCYYQLLQTLHSVAIGITFTLVPNIQILDF
jgi:hypothetical protein